jgi:hypothetical protein
MDRKEALLAMIDYGMKQGDDLAERLSDEEKASAGTYERWAPKDVFAHVAEWLRRDVERLNASVEPMPFVEADELDQMNQAIFAEHEKKDWGAVVEFFTSTFNDARRCVQAMSEEDLDRDREYSNGSKRTAWRMVAAHAVMHLSGHFAVVYDRMGDPAAATALEESTARILPTVDGSPEWIGTASYNLACHHALRGNPARAIELLGEALAGNPGLIEWSRSDSDLDRIRDNPAFESAYAGIG